MSNLILVQTVGGESDTRCIVYGSRFASNTNEFYARKAWMTLEDIKDESDIAFEIIYKPNGENMPDDTIYLFGNDGITREEAVRDFENGNFVGLYVSEIATGLPFEIMNG